MLIVVMLSCLYAECRYAECFYAECLLIYDYKECHNTRCHYAECHYADCRGAISASKVTSPPQSGGQKGASLGKALALLSNIILGWKGLLKLITKIL